MNQRAQYLIQILDKIGTPLLGAAEYAGNDADTAQIVASLLGKVVETSISMNQTLDLNPEDAQDDSLRVALAALAGSIVSNQYQQKGKIPEAADLSRVQAAMSAVLTFGDNFTLSPDHVARLEKLKADGASVDAHQINIQYVNALIPIINAVGAFSFGLPEQKLIMDISDRLVKRTAEMRETLLPGLSGGDDEKLAELAILHATSSIYASCHVSETKRLESSDTETEEVLSIAPVWEAFETRTAMLEAVVKNIMPGSAVTEAATGAGSMAPPVKPQPVVQEQPPPAQPETPPAAPPTAQETPPVQPPVEPQPPAPPPTAPPVAQQPPPAPAQTETASGGSGPMGFFAKPKDGETPPPEDNSVSPPLAQPETPPAAPPTAQETPPVQPPVEPQPPTPPPAEPPATPPTEEGDSGGDDQSGGNPMSFFGKKD